MARIANQRHPSTLIDEEWDCAFEVSRRGLVRDAEHPSRPQRREWPSRGVGQGS